MWDSRCFNYCILLLLKCIYVPLDVGLTLLQLRYAASSSEVCICTTGCQTHSASAMVCWFFIHSHAVIRVYCQYQGYPVKGSKI